MVDNPEKSFRQKAGDHIRLVVSSSYGADREIVATRFGFLLLLMLVLLIVLEIGRATARADEFNWRIVQLN